MNSLMNYGSDDDYDDSSEEKQTDWRGTSSRDKQASTNRQTDANYEEVQMDLSEGSNDSKPETRESSSSRRSRERGGDTAKDRRERERERDRDSKERDRGRYEKDRRNSRDKDGGSKSRSGSDYGRRERDRDRDNRDRKSRRSTSRERRRSRSPRRERETRHSRSRSRSRERNRKYSKRYDRGGKSQLEKNEPQKSVDDEKRTNPTDSDRFFMPGITGRFRDQIERRKQLWQKKDTTTDPKDNKNGQGKKVWEATTFAQDTDGKVANKFKRLMGIRGNTEGGGQGGDGLRKQEEMFSSMEQQYEVARTATHTMRGVGLGFGSFQR